jgi:hypothetical protein
MMKILSYLVAVPALLSLVACSPSTPQTANEPRVGLDEPTPAVQVSPTTPDSDWRYQIPELGTHHLFVPPAPEDTLLASGIRLWTVGFPKSGTVTLDFHWNLPDSAMDVVQRNSMLALILQGVAKGEKQSLKQKLMQVNGNAVASSWWVSYSRITLEVSPEQVESTIADVFHAMYTKKWEPSSEQNVLEHHQNSIAKTDEKARHLMMTSDFCIRNRQESTTRQQLLSGKSKKTSLKEIQKVVEWANQSGNLRVLGVGETTTEQMTSAVTKVAKSRGRKLRNTGTQATTSSKRKGLMVKTQEGQTSVHVVYPLLTEPREFQIDTSVLYSFLLSTFKSQMQLAKLDYTEKSGVRLIWFDDLPRFVFSLVVKPQDVAKGMEIIQQTLHKMKTEVVELETFQQTVLNDYWWRVQKFRTPSERGKAYANFSYEQPAFVMRTSFERYPNLNRKSLKDFVNKYLDKEPQCVVAISPEKINLRDGLKGVKLDVVQEDQFVPETKGK